MSAGTILLGLALLAADDGPRVIVEGPVPPVVVVGEPARWTVRVDGFEGEAVVAALPTADGVSFVAGSVTREVVQTIVDGEVVERVRLRLPIEATPARAGRVEFPLLRVATDDASWPTPAGSPLVVIVPEEVGGDVAFCELVSARESVFLHEPFRVTVRFGFAREFLADSVVPLFQRRLDVPVQLAIPGVTDLADARVTDVGAAGRGTTFALADAEGTARRAKDEVRGGRSFAVFELERRVVPTAAGDLVLAGPWLRYAYATRFREGLFERTPEDRREAVVIGGVRTVRVRPLPDGGRPPEFAGAVGRFAFDASATPTSVEVGESVRIMVTIAGEGDVEPGAPPPFSLADGMHVRGRLDDVRGGVRVVTLDVTPTTPAVDSTGPLVFASFDPAAEGYRTVETSPIALAVAGDPVAVAGATSSSAASAEPSSSVRPIPGVNDLHDVRPIDQERDFEAESVSVLQRRVVWVGGGVALPWVAALVFLVVWRARERRRRDPAGHRARRAARAFRSAIGRRDADGVGAFEAYLAARLSVGPAMVVGPDLAARLVAAGVSSDVADEQAGWVEEARAARFGGPPSPPATSDVAARVDVLERAFVAAEGPA